MSNYKRIQRMPTVIDNVHESVYRSYHILETVLEMLRRGDSSETVLDVAEFLNEYPVETESKGMKEPNQ